MPSPGGDAERQRALDSACYSPPAISTIARMGDERRLTIGRHRSCTVVIADQSVSRTHAALLVRRDGSLVLEDAGSREGTWIRSAAGERRLERAETVAADTHVRLGEVVLTVRDLLDAEPAPAPLPAPPHAATTSASPSPANPRAILVRCRCGAVKPRGSTCPECGR